LSHQRRFDARDRAEDQRRLAVAQVADAKRAAGERPQATGK
jgi:hypothetical protein